MDFHQLSKFDTTLSADSVEWCPVSELHHVFVCGTYQLQEGELAETDQKRKGILYLFSLTNEPPFFEIVQKIEMAGILDLKWAHQRIFQKVFLGCVTSDGDLIVYQLMEEETPSLKEIASYRIKEEIDFIALSLDWSTGCTSLDVRLSVSDSDGRITIFALQDSGLRKITSWEGHEYEAWITSFDYWQATTVYSGGDDGIFAVYDLRIGQTVLQNKSEHQAGVTSMHCHTSKGYDFLTGSYDEVARFWDKRNLRRPSERVETGGGVWRLKWDPHDSSYVLAACMYNGFSVISTTEHQVLAYYKDHESMAYGVDWSFLTNDQLKEKYSALSDWSNPENRLIAACSFYDHKMSLAAITCN